LPQLEKIWKELKEKEVAFVAVEAFQDTKRAKKLIKDKNLSFVFLEDEKIGDEKVYQKYSISAFPTNFIFGKDGRLISYHLGYGRHTKDEIKEEILKGLNEQK